MHKKLVVEIFYSFSSEDNFLGSSVNPVKVIFIDKNLDAVIFSVNILTFTRYWRIGGCNIDYFKLDRESTIHD